MTICNDPGDFPDKKLIAKLAFVRKSENSALVTFLVHLCFFLSSERTDPKLDLLIFPLIVNQPCGLFYKRARTDKVQSYSVYQPVSLLGILQ